MKHAEALLVAEEALNVLAPHCERIAISGSVRRRKPEVKDIEVVAIPTRVVSNLFGDETAVDPTFCAAVNQWPKVKGEPTGKYTQRVLPSGLKLDLFMADVDNWGLIYAVRTGSAAFSHQVLATQWVKRGYNSVDGRLTRARDGQVVPIREEADLFTLLGLAYVEPTAREV